MYRSAWEDANNYVCLFSFIFLFDISIFIQTKHPEVNNGEDNMCMSFSHIVGSISRLFHELLVDVSELSDLGLILYLRLKVDLKPDWFRYVWTLRIGCVEIRRMLKSSLIDDWTRWNGAIDWVWNLLLNEGNLTYIRHQARKIIIIISLQVRTRMQ